MTIIATKPTFLQPQTIKPIFRIFRSATSSRLFAVHQVNKKEESILELKDCLTFEEAQESMLEYEQLTQDGVVEVKTEVESV